MRNRAVFKKIEQAMESQDYTPEQLADATPVQVATVAKLDAKDTAEAERFWPGIKRLLLLDRQAEADAHNTATLTGVVQAWLDANFPSCEIEAARDGAHPFVTFWLNGKPDEPQAVEEVARG